MLVSTDYSEDDVIIVRKFLKEKLLVKESLHGFEAEKSQLSGILRRTISSGHSDSVLLIAPRGCGKSILVASCIKDLKKDFGNDFVLVQLNGLVHTDDNLALREIIRELHVEELNGEHMSGSFADNLMFVLQKLKTGDKASKPVIVILDEFQLFCTHRNQTLLYNLFDIAQSCEIPVCVVGMTCRVDITELLEKRVKSRFSHRQIYLTPNGSLDDRLSLINSLLTLSMKTPFLRKVNVSYISLWNKNVKDLLSNNKVLNILKKQLDIELSERPLRYCLFSLISRISSSSQLLTPEDFSQVFKKYSVDDKIELAKDLSVLEMCLLIAMKHQIEIYEGEPFNFEMIVKRYLKFVHQNSVVNIIQRPILLKAFERLKDLELILPVSSSSKNQKKEFLLYHLVLTKTQVKEAVKSHYGLPTDVLQWASSNVV